MRDMRTSEPGGRRLRRVFAADSGFAVPTVLLATVAAFGLGTATVVASINAQRGTVRDQASKDALSAGEAGIANALLRFNRIATTSAADACAPVGGGVTGAAGWCPQTIGPLSHDRGSFSYRVQVTDALGTEPAQIKIVSTGTVDGVSRRVTTVADSAGSGYQPFSGDASVIGLEGIHLESQAQITAGVATNGDLGLDANSAINCNYAQVGHGRGIHPAAGSVGCSLTYDSISLPPVNPGDVAVNNSNARICVLDPCNKETWDPVERRLSFNSGGSITLGSTGGEFNYALCQLNMRSNSYLYIAAGATVRIYFLSPEECAGETEPLTLHSNSKVQPTGSGTADLALLFVGSDLVPTTVDMASNTSLFCSQAFVLYGPRTDLELSSNNDICGGIAARSILLKSNVTINSTNGASDFELPNVEVPAHYGQPRDFIECTPVVTGSDPDSGC